jgi:hypothetical protein
VPFARIQPLAMSHSTLGKRSSSEGPGHLSSYAQKLPKKDNDVAISMVSQLCVCLAKGFEDAVVKANNGKKSPKELAGGELDCKWTTWKDYDQGYQMEHQLLRYVLAGRETALHQRRFVLACDAHDGCGKKLFNTVIGLPCNVTIIAPPQVVYNE